jgi:Flp pilus assembly CpaE family ATPase
MEDITLTIFGLPDNGIVDVIPSSISATTFIIYGVNSTGGTQATTAALNVAWNIRRSRG